MPRVLLAGKDWQFRALLRAQLREEGLEVIAQETSRGALAALTDLGNLPALLVADLTGSADPAAELRLLARWTSILPVWLVLSRVLRVDRNVGRLGFDRVIYRPLDMDGLVEQIKERVKI
ncbi:MAG: hypothetical protein ACRD10_11165 [Terriglobia bacterium]